MAKKGSKQASMAMRGHATVKPATGIFPAENIIAQGNNATEVSPAGLPLPVNDSATRIAFREFIELADIQSIKFFIAATTTSPDAENLRFLWARAFREGLIQGLELKEEKLDEAKSSGYELGFKEGSYSNTDLFQTGFDEGCRDERESWVIEGHGHHCNNPNINIDDYGTQSGTVFQPKPPQSESGTQTEAYIQLQPPQPPHSEISTQTEPPTPAFNVGTQVEPPISILAPSDEKEAKIWTNNSLHKPDTVYNHSNTKTDSPYILAHPENTPRTSPNHVTNVNTSPRLLCTKITSGDPCSPFSATETSLQMCEAANTLPPSSTTIFEPQTRPSIVETNENTSEMEYFIKNHPKNAKTDVTLPPASAETEWNVRSDDATSPSPSSTIFESPAPSSIPKTPDFDKKSPKKADLATSTPPIATSFDTGIPYTHTTLDSSSIIIQDLPEPSETTPIPQKSPKTTKIIENHPKIFRTATSSPENGSPKPTNATAIFVSQKTIPFTNTPLPNPPKITKKVENYPKISKLATSSPENGSRMRTQATAGSISQSSIPITIIPPPNPPKITYLNQKSPETPKSSRLLHNALAVDSFRPTNIDSTHPECLRASKDGNFIEKYPKNAKSGMDSPETTQLEPLQPLSATPMQFEHPHVTKCELSMPKSPFSSIPSHSSARNFNWADEPCDLDLNGRMSLPKFAPRDLSVLRSGSNPWRSLQNHRGRQRNQKFRPRKKFCHSYPSMFDSFNPHQCQPPPLPLPKNPVSLDWERDPRLSNLSQALQALGWFRR